MNIVISKEEVNYLNYLEIARIEMGSHLYGVSNENSDTDYLIIYKTSIVELYSGLPNYHQFQYKDVENNIDWIYCSELQFWKNLHSGDATINSDIILFSNNSFVEKYDDMRLDICRTYKIIKAYLGFAKRDLKQTNEHNFIKKLKHVYRGLYTANCLIDGVLPKIEYIQDLYNEDVPYFVEEIEKCKVTEKTLRDKINDMYNKGELQNYYIPKNLTNPLFQKLLDANNIKEFKY